jgi:hypothetical protein
VVAEVPKKVAYADSMACRVAPSGGVPLAVGVVPVGVVPCAVVPVGAGALGAEECGGECGDGLVDPPQAASRAARVAADAADAAAAAPRNGRRVIIGPDLLALRSTPTVARRTGP